MSESAQVDLNMIADSARAFVADHAGLAAARRRMRQAPGTDESCWRAMAELGWFGIVVRNRPAGSSLAQAPPVSSPRRQAAPCSCRR